MPTKLFPVWNPKRNEFRNIPEFYIMIEINHFVSGNDLLELDDIEFPEFYNCSVEAFMINTEDSKMSKIGPGAMRKIFKYIRQLSSFY